MAYRELIECPSLQKRESSKEDKKKREAQEEASGILNEAGRKLRGSGRWIGDRAETVKDKAGMHTSNLECAANALDLELRQCFRPEKHAWSFP